LGEERQSSAVEKTRNTEKAVGSLIGYAGRGKKAITCKKRKESRDIG